MEKDRHKKISKSLSYWLRHRPENIGIELDKNGWTSIDTLIEMPKKRLNLLVRS